MKTIKDCWPEGKPEGKQTMLNKILCIAGIIDPGEMSLLWLSEATWQMQVLVVFGPATVRLVDQEVTNALCVPTALGLAKQESL